MELWAFSVTEAPHNNKSLRVSAKKYFLSLKSACQGKGQSIKLTCILPFCFIAAMGNSLTRWHFAVGLFTWWGKLKGKSQRTVMLDSYQITSVSVANNAAYDLFTGLRWEYTTKICRKLDLMWASILVPSHYFIQWNYANDI